MRGNAEPAVGRILVSDKNLPSQKPSDSRIRPTETFDTAAYLVSSFPLAPSFPRRRESSPVGTEICQEKRFPQFRILDSRLRGNDGGWLSDVSETVVNPSTLVFR